MYIQQKKPFGHDIPWKKSPSSKKMVSVTTPQKVLHTNRVIISTAKYVKQFHPQLVTTAYGNNRLQQLQVHLFRRRLADSGTPKIVKPRKLTEQMRNKRF